MAASKLKFTRTTTDKLTVKADEELDVPSDEE